MKRDQVRVVMTVDNGVVGDSRVIKSARSAKEAGFDVVVLGHGLTSPKIDGVDARLYPALPARREVSGLRWLVRRIAMDPGDMRAHRLQSSLGKQRSVIDRAAVAVRWRLNKFAGYGSREWQKMYDLAEKNPRLASRWGIWEHLDPAVAGLNRGILAPLVELEPDIIHVHDYRTLPTAAAARRELSRRGREVRIVYDAHEYVPGLLEIGEKRLAAAKTIERKHIGIADAVLSVSDHLAARMKHDHGLPELPRVIVNAPAVPGKKVLGKGLRERLGLADSVPVLVYSGSVGSSRWLTHTVDILPMVPEAHVVLVVSHPTSNVIQDLEERARGLGVLDRFHVTRYVRPESLVDFLAGADVGLVPLRHTENVQDSLPSKTYEYLAAGVPQVVSDQRVMGEFVRSNGIGEVFVADDANSMGEAVRKVLTSPERYREAITPQLQESLTWDRQAHHLVSVYDELAATLANPPRGAKADEPEESAGTQEVATGDGIDLPVPTASVRLVVLPSNTDGQGQAWAAAAGTLPGVGAISITSSQAGDHAEAPDAVFPYELRADPSYTAAFMRRLTTGFTHVLLEGGWTPLEYTRLPQPVCQAVETLEEAGLRVAQVFHGPELRPNGERSAQADETLATAVWLGLDQFVAGPELLALLPTARWLPRAVGPEAFDLADRRSDGPPSVVHLPAEPSPAAPDIDSTLAELAAEGLIRMLDPQAGSASDLIAEADIVVDQIGLGGYSINAIKAMAAGRVVLGNVGSAAREVVGEEIPVVEVGGIEELAATVREMADAQRRADVGARGVSYARRWHDGTAAAEALAEYLEA